MCGSNPYTSATINITTFTFTIISLQINATVYTTTKQLNLIVIDLTVIRGLPHQFVREL
jgi:hypothetical protein